MQFITLWKAGREGGWLPGLGREQEGAFTECPGRWASADSAAGLTPWDPNLAEVSGWLGGRHQPGSHSPGLAPRSSGGPGTGELLGKVHAWSARNSSPHPSRGWVVGAGGGLDARGGRGTERPAGRPGWARPGCGRCAPVPPGPTSDGAAGQRPSAAVVLRPARRSPRGAPGAAGAVSLRSLPAPARRGEDSWALAI